MVDALTNPRVLLALGRRNRKNGRENEEGRDSPELQGFVGSNIAGALAIVFGSAAWYLVISTSLSRYSIASLEGTRIAVRLYTLSLSICLSYSV